MMPPSPFRADLFSSLVLLPTANALGHLAPAIGSSQAAVGDQILDIPVLILLFSVHLLLDSYDKYRDVPKEQRPHRLASFWGLSLFILILWSSYWCGYSTAIRIVWYLGLEVLWAVRILPWYTPKHGLYRIKLREFFGPLKSVFCGVMAGLMDAEPAAYHACRVYPEHCADDKRQKNALAYSIFYSFLRETAFDMRDIEEDVGENVSTMATFLGNTRTIGALIVVGITSEAWINGHLGLGCISRVIGTVGLSSWVAIANPRENRWTWAAYSLASLIPASYAQARLR